MAIWDGIINVEGQTVAQLTIEALWQGIDRGHSFAVGDFVQYKERPYKIVGTNGEFEYALEGYAFLVWEHELTSMTWKCPACRTKNSIENPSCSQCGSPE
jgi:hypothetical protein